MNRSALTLVEVVASLVLLASLLAGILMAFGSHQRQMRTAAQRQEACRVADQLLADWYGAAGYPPRRQQGRVDRTDWRWQTLPLRKYKLALHEFEVVQLRVFDARRPASAIRVEIVVPVVEPIGAAP